MKGIAAAGCVVLGLLLLTGRITREANDSAHEPLDHPTNRLSPSLKRTKAARRISPPSSALGLSLLEAVHAETDTDRRGQVLEQAIASVSDSAQSEVLDSLLTLDDPDAVELRERLVRRWAENNAPAAAAWAVRIAEGSNRQEALQQIAIAWVNSVLPDSVAWLRTLPEGESKQAARLAIAYEAARSEPLTALELVRELPATRERDDLLLHTLSQWAIADSPAAAAWAGKIPDLELQKRSLAEIAVASAEHGPAAAATLIANSLAAGKAQDRAAVAIVQRWVQSSPLEAASWVEQFPDIPSREAAVQNLVTLWTAASPQDAANWLGEMPDGSLRDIGLRAYSQALAQKGEPLPDE